MNRCKRTAKLYQVGKKTGQWVKAKEFAARTIRKAYNAIMGGK